MKTFILLIAALFTGTITFAQNKITPAAPGVTYGKTITAEKAINVAALSTALNTDSVYNGRVSGKVVEVCTKKGCFIKIARENGTPVMIRFTDYAYFMPQNIVGKNVVVEGKATVNETSVAKLQHYAADAGKSKEEIAKINQPKKDIEIMADGVLVVD
ncbi:DUF4920 domain-containing protein [Mucilaginibacter celer]|uniref:DUF4920 domain-containing protein n=1 Tax=Mucilaginibacter celer TaxID=2305508 RepID=A0A494VZC9_9SPHI|nr:DUF4920 domain-containing protein [Mucilaginibacter celer]AYL96505.1 DUF4920 domain-containing protein [Mucilaginibacter celer]